ncbi:MAG: hypothetical protein K1X28_11000 [Parachlamydiales bacterium]|nr:hypothetical protein [Parachlamydiales bacterium]
MSTVSRSRGHHHGTPRHPDKSGRGKGKWTWRRKSPPPVPGPQQLPQHAGSQTGSHPPDGDTMVVQGVPSTVTASSRATLKPKDANELKLERTFTWKGEKYKLKLYVPLPTPDKDLDSDTELQRFKANADELADMMVLDLQKQLEEQYSKGEAGTRIEPGDSCNVVFDKNGYVIADDKVQVDPEHPDSYKGKKAFAVNNAASKTLAQAACAGKAKEMHEALQSEALKPLRETARKEAAEKGAAAAPVNLIWDRNSCFLDAPLQQLLNDPTVAEDLNHPEYFVDGEKNVLYQAVQKYREAQLAGKPVDLASILRQHKHFDNTGKPMDAQTDGWKKFEACFDFDAIPAESHLRGLFKKPWSAAIGSEDIDISTFAAAALRDSPFNENELLELTDVVHLAVRDRLTLASSSEKLSEKTSPEENTAFLKALSAIQQLSEDELSSLESALGKKDHEFSNNGAKLEHKIYCNLRKKIPSDTKLKNLLDRYYLLNSIRHIQFPDSYDDAATNKTKAALILDNPDLLSIALPLLKPSERKPIDDRRIQGQVINKTPIKMGDGTVKVGGKEYEVAGFTAHTLDKGGSAHYVTYVKKETEKGTQYYLLNDLRSTPQPISPDKFLEAAETACFYTLHRKGLTAKATKAGSGDKGKAKPKVEEIQYEPAKADDQLPGDNTIKVGTGSMSGLETDCVIAHPSNENLLKTHPQVKDVVMQSGTDLLQRDIKTQIAANKRFGIKKFGKKSYTPRGEYLGSADHLKSVVDKRTIVSVALRDGTHPKEHVEDLLDACIEEGATDIAIPLIGDADTMKAIISNYFFQKGSRSLTVRIIKPKQAPLPPPPARTPAPTTSTGSDMSARPTSTDTALPTSTDTALPTSTET